MSRQVNYFSFGSSDEFSLKRQLAFCTAMANYIGCDFDFYCFTFPDEKIVRDDRITVVSMDQWDSFFEHFSPRYEKDTMVFNHAFFHNYLSNRMKVEGTAFIYHKLDVEFLFLKKIGTENEIYEKHRKLESELLRNCDWMYTSSNIILNYFQENEGYHQHKYSLLPSPIIGQEMMPAEGQEELEKVNFVHIGPVSNRGIKYIKKILLHANNHMTVLSDEVNSIRRQGFTKDERFRIVPLTEANLNEVLPKMDYALIRPKSDPSSWIRAERLYPVLLSYGIQLLIPKDYDTAALNELNTLLSLENLAFNLPVIDKSQRVKNAKEAFTFFDLNEVHNSLKFRNAKNIHLRLVSKLK